MSLFVTFDGPNGSGKTTMINNLKSGLEKDFSIYQTREPSNTEFGRYVKTNEHSIRGLAYAYLITAERAYHYDIEIKDALEKYDIVLCDRYIGSSLALQVFDGVNIDKIWDVNKDFLMPDLGIFMIASEGELTSRLMARHELSFFEKEMKRSDEIHYYNLAYEFMFRKGIPVIKIENSADKYEENLLQVQKMIIRKMEEKK